MWLPPFHHPSTIAYFCLLHYKLIGHTWVWASQAVLSVKNPPISAGDIRGVGLIPGSGRSPGGGQATHSSILSWRSPGTEDSGRIHFTGSQRVGHDWAHTHSSFCILTPLHGCSFSRYSDLRHLLVVLFRGSTLALIVEKVSSTLDPGQVVRQS